MPIPAGYHIQVKDCLAGMAAMPPASVDLVVTSPPYNLGIAYSRYQDRRSDEDYLAWCRAWAAGVRRILKPRGSFFLNLGACPSNPLLPHELIVTLRKQTGFVLQNTFHWIKSISLQTRGRDWVSAGHFKPIHSPRFVNDCHEFVFHLTKTGDTPLHRLNLGVPYSDKSNVARWAHTKGKDLRCRGNNWFIPYRTIVSRSRQRPHPASFPPELAAFCMRIHGCGPAARVLDPFLGIGSSALAARACGIRNFTGFDIDAGYAAEARKRLAAAGREKA